MLEPAHFFPLQVRGKTPHDVGATVAQVQQHIDEVQPDAGNQYGGHRHQGQRAFVLGQAHFNHGTLVLAKQALHALQGNGVDVPGVARDVGDTLHQPVSRGMKAVIHAGRQTQGHVLAVRVPLREFC